MMAEAQCESDSKKLRHVARGRRVVTENTPLVQQEGDTTSTDSRPAITHPGVTFRTCKAACVRRTIPVGKGLFLVFLIYFIETLALYASVKGINELLFDESKHRDHDTSVFGNFLYSLIDYSLGRLFYPLGGILADSFLGRFKVIEIGTWLLWSGLTLTCVSLSIADKIPYSVGGVVLPIVCIILIAIGSGSVEVNAISFGVDQLPQGCPSDQISSYFWWLYFIRNTGQLLGIAMFIALSTIYRSAAEDLPEEITVVDKHYKNLIPMMLATALLTCTLVLHIVKHHWYFKNKRRDSPIKTIGSVSWFSLTVKRHAPIRNRTFRYGEARQSRFNLAKYKYDGKFDDEVVEEVKTFYQLMFFILSIGGYFASYGAAYSMLGLQFSEGVQLNQYLDPYFNALVNTAIIVLVLPFVNHGLLPYLNMSLKVRVGIGQLLNLLAIVAAAFLQGTVEVDNNSHGQERLVWLLLPTILLALGEVVTFVTCLEFIYAQAPESMKGLLTGLFYFVFGTFNGISSIVFYFYPTDPETNSNAINWRLWFYVIFFGVSVVGLLLYTLVACLYRNRQRPAEDEEDLERRIQAQNVFFASR